MNDVNESCFLAGFDLLKIPVIENGVPTWDEKFPIAKIEALKKAVGIKKFSSQMMLVPVDISRGRFDLNKLNFYNSEIIREEVNRILKFSIMDRKIVSASCWWDPSYGSVSGDKSVVCVVFIDETGRYYLHDIKYLYHKQGEAEVTSADDQCRQVAEFIEKNFVPSIYVESNGIGKFLPEFLRSILKQMNINASVVEKTSRTSKVLRIIDTFDAITSAGYLFVNEAIKNTEWIAEFQEWSVDAKCHDDGLDSVAGAISSAPYRLATSVFTPIRRNGSIAGRTFKVKSYFDL